MNKKILIHVIYIAFLTLAGVVLHQSMIHGGIISLLQTDGTAGLGITAYGVATYALTVWFFISFIGGLAGVNSISAGVQNHQNDKTMLQFLRANPAIYAKSRMLIDGVAVFILNALMLLFVFPIANIPFRGIIPAVVILVGFRLVGEAVNLLLFRHIGKHFGHKMLSNIGIIIYLPALIVPYFAGVPNWAAVLSNPWIILAALPGVLAFLYIRKYPLYNDFLRDKIACNEILYSKVNTLSASERQGVAKWSKHIQTDNLQDDKHKSKIGFAYLNAIFFDRHKKFFANKIFVRCAILLALFAAGSLFFGILDFELTSFFYLSPVVFFVFSMASMGRVVTASVFSNCDVQMLHYPYYRTRQTILASFKSRFIVILRYNFILTVVVTVSALVTLAAVFGEMDFFYAGVFVALMIFTGVFFAFNDLFLYYVIQPFDSAGKSKSIVYSILNFALGLLVWFQMRVQVGFITYATIIIAITLAYIGIGTVLLLALSPKNFKLR
jgi:hypothetical protein